MNRSESPEHKVLQRLLSKSKADPERIRRVIEDYDAYLESFGRLRQQRAWRRFTELDQEMGRDTGYYAALSAKEEALPFDRLLMGLDFLGSDLETFARSVSRRRPPNNPPRNRYLADLCDRPIRETAPECLERLREWGRHVAVDTAAERYPVDAEAAIELSHSSLAATTRLVQGTIEALAVSRPKQITPRTCEEVCKTLVVWADCLRNQGKRFTAAQAFDLAFELEQRIDRPLTRAFSYRMASYLLADWGRLDESLEFAQRSERLCLWEGDRAGLARSMFIQATLLSMNGDHPAAIKGFKASMAYLGENNWHFALAIRIEIALAWLELGNTNEARQALGEPPTRLNEITKAHFLTVQAEISSRLGDVEEAEEHFEQADEAFCRHASLQDRLILGLKRVRHYSRNSLPQAAIALAKKLVEIASGSSDSTNHVTEAVVLDLLNKALAGEVSVELINEAILRLQSSPALRLH